MIPLLLDQGVRHPVAQDLRDVGWDAIHTQDCGLARALDSEILNAAVTMGRAVVTLDSDFSALLALSGSSGPSVVHVRIHNLSRQQLRRLLIENLPDIDARLASGCIASITPRGIRIRRLPIMVSRP